MVLRKWNNHLARNMVEVKNTSTKQHMDKLVSRRTILLRHSVVANRSQPLPFDAYVV